MNPLALALAAFLAPSPVATTIVCPPEIGQMRWDNIESHIKSDDIALTGTVWDRDRDGKPSAGDVMRIDRATRGGSVIDVTETWMVVKGELARTLARDMKRSEIKSSCETPFKIEGVPTIHNGKALARYIDELSPPPAGATETGEVSSN